MNVNKNNLFIDSHGVIWEYHRNFVDGCEAFGPTGFATETPWHVSTVPFATAIIDSEDGWSYLDVDEKEGE